MLGLIPLGCHYPSVLFHSLKQARIYFLSKKIQTKSGIISITHQTQPKLNPQGIKTYCCTPQKPHWPWLTDVLSLELYNEKNLLNSHLLVTCVLKILSHSLPWEFIFPLGELFVSVDPIHFPFKFQILQLPQYTSFYKLKSTKITTRSIDIGFLICPSQSLHLLLKLCSYNWFNLCSLLIVFKQPNQGRSVKCSQADDRTVSAAEPAAGFQRIWCSWSMSNAQLLCTMSSQNPGRSQGFSHPFAFSIKQLSPPGVRRVKLSLAVGLTQLGPWMMVLFPYAHLHPARWHIAFPDKKKKKVNGTESLQGAENFFRGSPWGKWKVTGSLFCPSIMPWCRTAVSQEDLDPTLRWCHWCQNWAGVYK